MWGGGVLKQPLGQLSDCEAAPAGGVWPHAPRPAGQFLKNKGGDFPGGPVAKTVLLMQGFDPWSGN